tara:strand:+ start:821 stop:991 length:171 start_codon:yes stop_codon:yes gene_type:complete
MYDSQSSLRKKTNSKNTGIKKPKKQKTKVTNTFKKAMQSGLGGVAGLLISSMLPDQ